MTELYVMNHYLRPDILMESGTDKFDEWAATFGNVVTKNQQTASGTLQLKTSFASFKNLPELMTMYKDFADIRTANQLDYLEIPKLKGGKIQIVEVDASPEQREYVKELAEMPLNSGYFFVDRKALGQLAPRQMFVYLFLCKSFAPKSDVTNRADMRWKRHRLT